MWKRSLLQPLGKRISSDSRFLSTLSSITSLSTTTLISNSNNNNSTFFVGCSESHNKQQQGQRRYFITTPEKKNTNYRPRVVIVGTGWAGNTLARRLDKKLYDVRLISPANHFLFTPLLPSTAVGTLEFRAIQEPVRTIPGLGEYYQAKARRIENGGVVCEDLFKRKEFSVKYDYLCIAAGNKTNTFGIPGVAELEGCCLFFLKHLYHARQIRNRVLECMERATNPQITDKERERLLSFIVVGGGPTSCEFTAELHDFLQSDVAKWYPDLIPQIRITLVEAGPGLLGSTFDHTLASYYLEELEKKNVTVRLGTAVVGIEDRPLKQGQSNNNEDGKEEKQHQQSSQQQQQNTTTKNTTKNTTNNDLNSYTVAKFADGTELPFGTMIWSAGLAPVKFIENSSNFLELSQKGKKIITDEYLRVKNKNGRIFAMGDCATIHTEDTVRTSPLPATASVAEQQALYLAECFNLYYKEFNIDDDNKENLPLPGKVVPSAIPYPSLHFMNSWCCTPSEKFVYINRGGLVSLGMLSGVADIYGYSKNKGLVANLAWKSAYLTKQLSYSNMLLIPMYWFKAYTLGRDISRF